MQLPRKSPRRNFKKEQALSSVFCGREEFWEHFPADLEGCTRSLLIVSPYVTADGTERLRKRLKELRERNVHITVYTHSPKVQDDDKGCDSALELLNELGVEVIVCRVHAKMIVIDDYIWWEGSLNALSFGQSLEQMRRFEGLQARNLLRRIGLDRLTSNDVGDETAK
jgi:hypothetical protein